MIWLEFLSWDTLNPCLALIRTISIQMFGLSKSVYDFQGMFSLTCSDTNIIPSTKNVTRKKHDLGMI